MGDRDQVPRCEPESRVDHEQELGDESVALWVRNDGERSMGVVQEVAEERVNRDSGESRRDEGCWSEKKMG